MKPRFTGLTAFFFLFVLLSSQILSAGGAGNGARHLAEENKVDEKPSLDEVVTDAISMMRSPHRISWHKIKTLLNKFQIRLSPPNLDFRGASNEANAVEEMKEAARESFRSSKSTVERSARSAAEAVQRTAEKVKENLPDEEEPRAEL